MAYQAPSITASGITFGQWQASGPSGHLEKLITAIQTTQAAVVAPTVATTYNATGGGASGGLLAAGTYYLVTTEGNGVGETSAGPESAQLTVGSTNIPQATFPTLKTGNTYRNVYIGALNGMTGGPYTLYADGITTATFNLAVAAPSSSLGMVTPPKATRVTLPLNMIQLLRAARTGNLQDVYKSLGMLFTDFNRGDPLTYSAANAKLHDIHLVFAVLSQLCLEAGVLIDANPGTIKPTVTGTGGSTPRRSWP